MGLEFMKHHLFIWFLESQGHFLINNKNTLKCSHWNAHVKLSFLRLLRLACCGFLEIACQGGSGPCEVSWPRVHVCSPQAVFGLRVHWGRLVQFDVGCWALVSGVLTCELTRLGCGSMGRPGEGTDVLDVGPVSPCTGASEISKGLGPSPAFPLTSHSPAGGGIKWTSITSRKTSSQDPLCKCC